MPNIALVVFDWAGTTVDFGCMAPVAAFVEAFARHDVPVTIAQARQPMGLPKRDHIQAMMQMSDVAALWRSAHSRDATSADVDALYREFIPLQMEVIDRHCELVPGLEACIAALRSQGIKIGATTGYFRAAAERVYELARRRGYAPEYTLCAEDVPVGRPAPWMVFRIMEAAGVYPPSRVVKLGDTVPDVEEGLNAGAWSVGVTQSSSEVGCTLEEWNKLTTGERQKRISLARSKLLAAGAHHVIDSLTELPELLRKIEAL
jgi:phosphonoacetaldehyde hydrolase